MKLTQHFSFDELTETSFTDVKDENKAEAMRFIPQITRFCLDLLEPVRIRFGAVRVTSGYRCNRLNKLVGSSPMSQHTNQGDIYTGAADIQFYDANLLPVFDWMMDNLKFHQLVFESTASAQWIHIGYEIGERDGQVFKYNPETKVREQIRQGDE